MATIQKAAGRVGPYVQFGIISSFTPNRTYWARTGETLELPIELSEALDEDLYVEYDVAPPDQDLPVDTHIYNQLPTIDLVHGDDYTFNSPASIVIPAGSTEAVLSITFHEQNYWRQVKAMHIRLRNPSIQTVAVGLRHTYWVFCLHEDGDPEDWPRVFLAPTEDSEVEPPDIQAVPVYEGAINDPIQVPVKLSGPNPEGAVIWFTTDFAGALITSPYWDAVEKTVTLPAGTTGCDLTFRSPATGTFSMEAQDVSEARRNLVVHSRIEEERWDTKRSHSNNVGIWGIPAVAWPGMWNFGIDNTQTIGRSRNSLKSTRDAGVTTPSGNVGWKYTTADTAGNHGGVMMPFEQDTAGYPWDKVEYCNRPAAGKALIFSCYVKEDSAKLGKIYILDRTIQARPGWGITNDRYVEWDFDDMLNPVAVSPELTGLEYFIADAGGGWYRVGLSWETPAGLDPDGNTWDSHVMQFIVIPSLAANGPVTENRGTYICDAQVEHADLGAALGVTNYQDIKDSQRRTPGNCILGHPHHAQITVK